MVFFLPTQPLAAFLYFREAPQPFITVFMKYAFLSFALTAFFVFCVSLALPAQPGIYFEPWPLNVTAPNIRLYVDLSSPHCNCPELSDISEFTNPLYIWTWNPNESRPLINGADVNNGQWSNSNENLRLTVDPDNPNLWYYDFLGASLTQFYGVSANDVLLSNIDFLVKEKNGSSIGNNSEQKSPDLRAYVLSGVPESNSSAAIDFELFSTGAGDVGSNLVWSGVANDSRLFRLSGSKAVSVNDNGNILNPSFMDMDQVIGSGNSLIAFTGMAFSPNYEMNGHIFTYIVYEDEAGELYNRISRYTISASDPNQVDMNTGVLVLDFPQDSEINVAGHIEFGQDDLLYISTGDGGLQNDPLNRAQDLNSLLGKILRIDVSSLPYTIPFSNPFTGNPSARQEIWIYGLRNPKRFSFHQSNGEMYLADGVPETVQKVFFNSIFNGGGTNYGWSCAWAGELNPEFCPPNQLFPPPVGSYNAYSWGPGLSRCQITSGQIYQGSQYPELVNQYMYLDRCSGEYWTKQPGFSSPTISTTLITAPSLVAMSENHSAEIFAVSSENANIYKMVKPCVNYTATLAEVGEAFQVAGNFSPISVEWYVSGIPYYSDPNTLSLIPEWDGSYQAVLTSNNGCKVLSNTLQQWPVSTSSRKPLFDFNIYPNPANNQLSVQSSVRTFIYEVYALDGKRLQAGSTPTNGSTNAQTIDVSSLSGGFYLLKITTEDGQFAVSSFVKE